MGHEPGFGNNPSPAKPVKLDKKSLDKIDQWVDKQENVLDVLVPFVKLRASQYLDQWLAQMILARTDASAPAEESKSYWLFSLAGNLLWAASVFVPGAGVVSNTIGKMTDMGKVMYATMQIGGAVVGAGIVDQVVNKDTGVPTGMDVVADALNDKRKLMAAKFTQFESWSATLLLQPNFHASQYRDLGRDKYLSAVDALLWNNLFPNFAFEDYKGMYRQGLNAINGALADFNRQFKAWSDAQRNWAEHDSTGRYGINAVAYDEARKKWARLRPFKPQLKFQ